MSVSRTPSDRKRRAHRTLCFLLLHSPQEVVVLSTREWRDIRTCMGGSRCIHTPRTQSIVVYHTTAGIPCSVAVVAVGTQDTFTRNIKSQALGPGPVGLRTSTSRVPLWSRPLTRVPGLGHACRRIFA